jgi:hypothetical protein
MCLNNGQGYWSFARYEVQDTKYDVKGGKIRVFTYLVPRIPYLDLLNLHAAVYNSTEGLYLARS